MPTLAEQSAAINADLPALFERDKEHHPATMLAQWSAELSLKHGVQVVVLLAPGMCVIAYPLLTQHAIEAHRQPSLGGANDLGAITRALERIADRLDSWNSREGGRIDVNAFGVTG